MTRQDTSQEITYTLLAQGGPLNGQRWVVDGPLLIGRDPSCDIVIPDRQVSRRHARLWLTPEGPRLEDLHSKNGTHHNGRPVMGETLLADGDLIQIALTQRFLLLSSAATVPLNDLPDAAPFTGKALRLDEKTHQVWLRGEEVLPPLSAAQFRLLVALYRRQGHVVPREALIRAVWGEEAVGISNQALDALVRRLRDRLAALDPEHPYIVTVRGHGLRLDNPDWE